MPEPRSSEKIGGSCHCGNLRFTFEWPTRGSIIPVRACSCGLCTKHKAVWTSHPNGRFSLVIGDEDQLNRYRFGTKTADFHVCRACGVHADHDLFDRFHSIRGTKYTNLQRRRTWTLCS
jgi:hypothetical protein